MSGKGDRNRSANRAYWDADYWKKDKKKRKKVVDKKHKD